MKVRIFLTTIGVASLVMSSLYAMPLVSSNPTGVAQDQDYYTQDVGNTRLIFSQANKDAAERVAGVEQQLQALYEQSFGYRMDSRLNVGLMSSYNQIANGFSTQFPTNRQINYLGGAQLPDYFAASSWLLILLTHETAHNYQLNAKDNPVSSNLYAVFGNGPFLSFIPAITPNIFESSFLLEGNAVMNESRHGLGGRLYSGLYRALTYAQAQAGYLTAERLYNQTLHFPYGEHHYILGGSYMYYLAQHYGVDRVNSYFKQRSKYLWWPFLVSKPMQDTLGKNFTTTLSEWAQATQQQAQNMHLVQGDILAHSQFYSALNEQQNQVVFLINGDGRSRAELVRYHKATQTIEREHTGHLAGKVYQVGERYYSQASDHTSVWRIYQGLFDDDSQVLDETKSKLVQGWLADGRMAYFASEQSFLNPQLYVGDEFYASVHSSVLVKGDDLYYFVQQGRTRTLYKNTTPLYQYQGFYGFPVDSDSQGALYFIANSQWGSTLYRYREGVVERVLDADNVIDARLANDQQVLVAAVSADDYYYSLTAMQIQPSSPYEVRLLWDDELDTALADAPPLPLSLDQPYGLFNNLRYSGTSVIFNSTVTEQDGQQNTHWLYQLSASFDDPLTRSSYRLWAQRDNDLSDLVGVGMSNNQFFLQAGVLAYYVAHQGEELRRHQLRTRDAGLLAELRLPFLDVGYWQAEWASTYYQDYQIAQRQPLAMQLSLSRLEQQGYSWLANREFSALAYGVRERGDEIRGGQLQFTWGLANQWYVQASGQYSRSDTDQAGPQQGRGVELRSAPSIGNDPSVLVIPSLKDELYVQRAQVLSAGISKVFDGAAYSFAFPVSLRREALRFGYRQYAIDDVAGVGEVEIGQTVLGLDLDLLLVNILPLSLSLEAVYNSDDSLTERTQVQAGLMTRF